MITPLKMPENPGPSFTLRPALLDILQRKSEAVVPAFENKIIYQMVAEKMNKIGLVFNAEAISTTLQKLREAPSSMKSKLDEQYDINNFLYSNGEEMSETTKKQRELTLALIKGRLALAFDPGLSRNIAFYPNPDEEDYRKLITIKEEGTYIFRRSTFISDINKKTAAETKKIGYAQRPNFSFIDISNVRKADRDVKIGNKAADLLVNRAAQAIENAAIKFCKACGIDKSHYPTIGRYGGDEFVIGWIPKLSSNEQIQFENVLKEYLSSELTHGDTPTTAYYGAIDNNEIAKTVYTKDKITLKNNKIDWIETPTDKDERYVFDDYFQRGLILTERDLQIVKGKKEFKENGKFSLNKYNKYQQVRRKPTELDALTSDEQKVDFLALRHKNFAVPLFLAQYWDEVESNESGIKTTKRQGAMIEYVKEIVFDKLLGYGVVSKFDFQEQIENGNIDYSISIDLKFIKEMNELVGYAEADESITALWNAINSTLDHDDRTKCTFARAGGMFFIGVNKGAVLSETAFKKLKALKTFELDVSSTGRGSLIKVPLGNSLTNETYPSAGKKNNLNEVINNCEEDFFFNILSDLKKDPELLNTVEIEIDPLKYGNNVEYGELLWRFFRLKRYDERVIKLIDQFTKYDPTHPLRTTVIQLYGVLSSLDFEEYRKGLRERLLN